MSKPKSRQNVNDDVKKWNKAIQDAEVLLEKVENRAARLKGAIKTFTELRDCGHVFDGDQTTVATQSTSQNSTQQHSV